MSLNFILFRIITVFGTVNFAGLEIGEKTVFLLMEKWPVNQEQILIFNKINELCMLFSNIHIPCQIQSDRLSGNPIPFQYADFKYYITYMLI